MIFHRTTAEDPSAPDLDLKTTTNRLGMAINTSGLEPASVIPRGRQFGALVTYPNGRGVALCDGALRWGETVESRTGVRILLLDEMGPDNKLRYLDESGGVFLNWLDAEKKARRRWPIQSANHLLSPSNRLPLRLFLSRIHA